MSTCLATCGFSFGRGCVFLTSTNGIRNLGRRCVPSTYQRNRKNPEHVIGFRNGHSMFHDKLRINRFVQRLSPVERASLLEELQSLEKVNDNSASPGKSPPTFQQLRYVALYSGIPFIGFGILDNTIMLTAGEYIDIKFGAMLGISTMAAAALGNMLSDIVGIGTAGAIEQTVNRLGLKSPSLSSVQMEMKASRWASNLGRAMGVTIGCFIGMWPLLLYREDGNRKEEGRDRKEEGRDRKEEGGDRKEEGADT